MSLRKRRKGHDSPSLVNENSARQPMWSDQSSDFEILSEDDAGAQKGSKIYMTREVHDQTCGMCGSGKR
jgi:hypothetical protein